MVGMFIAAVLSFRPKRTPLYTVCQSANCPLNRISMEYFYRLSILRKFAVLPITTFVTITNRNWLLIISKIFERFRVKPVAKMEPHRVTTPTPWDTTAGFNALKPVSYDLYRHWSFAKCCDWIRQDHIINHSFYSLEVYIQSLLLSINS